MVSGSYSQVLDVFNCVSFRYHNQSILNSDKINVWMCQSVIQWIAFSEKFHIFIPINWDLRVRILLFLGNKLARGNLDNL